MNYFLDPNMRCYAGVDVTDVVDRSVGYINGLLEVAGVTIGATDGLSNKNNVQTRHKKRIWERWERMLFGFRPSPYICTRGYYWGKEIIRGDRRKKNNLFRWTKVELNLSGSLNFDPRRSWVYKVNEETQRVAADFVTFVDAIKVIGGNYTECTSAIYIIATMLNYLGEQNAARKIREASQTPGMWTGAVMETDDKNIYLSTSQEKRDKGKAIIEEWWSVYEKIDENSQPYFNHKEMQRKRGLLVHLSTIYPWIKPLLKGVNHTLEVWRGKRDIDGWKFPDKKLIFLPQTRLMNQIDSSIG